MAARRIDPELAEHARRLGDAFAAQSADELLVDYTWLFLGPVQALARPYASVWLTGESMVMQGSTMGVLALYGQAGFEIDEDFRELPDHVAVELEFLYLLIHQENQALLGPFILAVHDGAQSDFYRELAELTELFVRLEATRQGGPILH